MKNDFQIINLTRKFILNLNNIVKNFPNKEKLLKDKIYETSFNLLETMYHINYLSKKDYLEERIHLEYNLLYKISMIDFYFEIAYLNKYISEKKCINLNKQLTIIFNKIQGWIKSEKSNN